MEINNRLRTTATATLVFFVTFLSALLSASPAETKWTAKPAADPTDTTRLTPSDTTKTKIADTLAAAADTTLKGRDAGKHRATWYRTAGHRKVHRHYPTAAYNMAPIGTRLLVTNLINNKSCTVVVTDRMGKTKKGFIDLSHMAFGIIAEHGWGNIPVQVTILD